MGKESLIFTYDCLVNFKDKNSNYVLSLSEFIDNSISSFLETNDNDINGLNIDISFDYSNKDNWTLTIEDNAGGIERERMVRAIQPNDTKDKSQYTGYNQYGLGMKYGILYFGLDFAIYSKKINQPEYYLELYTTKHNGDEEVFIETFESKTKNVKNNSGTKIVISHLHNNRKFTEQRGKQDFIKNGLAWRYNKLINNGMKINIEIKYPNGTCHKFSIESEYKLKSFKKEQLFYKGSQKIIEERQKQYQKILAEITRKYKSNDDGELFNIFLNKLESNESLEYEMPIKINDKETLIKFGVLAFDATNKVKKCGITLYHENRGIYHGPNDDENKMENFQFLQKNRGSGGDPKYRWLFGEIDLTGIERPETNKAGFIWSANGEQELKDFLKEKIYDKIEPILQLIVDIDKVKEQDNDSLAKSVDEINNKVNLGAEFYVNDDGLDTKGEIELPDGEKYKIQIRQSNEIDFIDYHIDEQNHFLTITYEPENAFWQPFVSKIEVLAKIVYPLGIVITLADLYSKCRIARDNATTDEKKFTKYISEMIRKYCN